MHKIIEAGKQLAERRFVRYVIVGGTTFALDFFVLVILHGALGVDLLIAATISYWSSIGFNFWVNRMWTFGATDSGVAKHLTFYLTLLALNYGFSIAFIAAGTSLGMHFTIAKILATGFQTIWTYIAYKRFIFK